MLGVTGILVGAVFLTSIFLQTVLGFSALETGLAFLPFALAITVGTLVARHLLGHLSPRVIATVGLLITVAASAVAVHRRQPARTSRTDILPGLSVLGLGVGMVFVPVSVTSMAGIPASHAGVASGFLMTGHEIGAALGVAVLSAVASTAGTLTTAAGAADAFSAGFVGAAVIGAVVAVFALLRMPAARVPAAAATCTCTEPQTRVATSGEVATARPDGGGPRAARRIRSVTAGGIRWTGSSRFLGFCHAHLRRAGAELPVDLLVSRRAPRVRPA